MVQIIDVAVVANRNVAAGRPVDVRMIGRGHGFSFRAGESPRAIDDSTMMGRKGERTWDI
jgi:hypothetical protein